jgi:hypothetical protein
MNRRDAVTAVEVAQREYGSATLARKAAERDVRTLERLLTRARDEASAARVAERHAGDALRDAEQALRATA